jgi:chromosome segregation ATPase
MHKVDGMKEETSSALSTVQPDTRELTADAGGMNAEVAAQVAMALGALDSRYRENVAAYAQELHTCTHQIETVRIELEHLQEQITPYDEALDRVGREIEHTLRMLEHFTEQWIQHTLVISEVESEMKKIGESNDTLLRSRQEERKRLQFEMDDLELKALQDELERQNLLLKMDPLTQKIDTLKKRIRKLESHKRYVETVYLHRITQVGAGEPPKLPGEEASHYPA